MDILSEIGFFGYKLAAFLMESKLKLTKHDSSKLPPDPSSYKRLIGKLPYLTITRPDLAYSSQTFSQFMANPTTKHLQVTERVLRYIKATANQGIYLSATSPLHLKAYSDSDCIGCLDTQQSITSFTIFLRDSPISWKFKK